MRHGTSFKIMRRHDPGEATEKIIGSPGGATSSGADGAKNATALFCDGGGAVGVESVNSQ